MDPTKNPSLPACPPTSFSSRWRLRSGVLAFLLASACGFATPSVVIFDASNTTVTDTWVASSISGDNGASNILTLGGTANREIFVRFHVDERAGTGTPTLAKLRLYQKTNFGSGATFEVYAANNRKAGATNDWAESIEWVDRPAFTTFLVNGTSKAAAGYVDLVLPDYISGPGDYSFRIRTSSTLQHNFDSSEGTNLPLLEVTVEAGSLNPNSPYYLRSPANDLFDVGDLYRIRYQQSNPTVGAIDTDSIGYFDVTKQPYGAKNDGSADATWAIQRAVSEARDARVALYFPNGTYKVSRTIQMAQGSTPDPHEMIGGIRVSLREFPCVLLGSRTGTRPKIVVDTSSTFFNSAGSPQAVLRFWSRHNSANPEDNTANTQYNQVLDGIDVDLSGKVGAIGVDMDSAQGTILANSTITATNGTTHGYAGIFGGTGPGGYTYGVTVTGGQYGGRFERAHCPLIINSKFTGQTVYSLWHENRGPLTLVGVEVFGKPIKLVANFTSGWLAAVNVIDSRLETTGGGLLIDSDRSVSVTNSYLKNGSSTAAAIRQTDPVGTFVQNYALTTTGWRNVKEYAFGVNIEQQAGDTAARVPYWIGGIANVSTTPHSLAVNVASVPTQFSAGTGNRHALTASPQFSATDVASGVINAKTTSLGIGPIGEGFSNNAARLNALIAVAGSRPIFIPRGEFYLEGAVNMVWNTQIFGVGQTISTLRATSTFTGPMISTGDAPGATSLLADLKLLLPANSNGAAYMIWWRAGANSTVKNVALDHRPCPPATEVNLTIPLVQINANGGGKWAGFCIIEGGAASANGRFLEVSGTTQALKFYMLNLEHCATSPQAKFTGASNFDIYQTKAESIGISIPDKELLWFTNCQMFRAFGFGGIAEPTVGKTLVRLVGSLNDNYMVTQIQGQQTASPDPNTYWRLIDEGATNGINKVRGDQQTVLYKRGTPPNQ